MYVRVNVVPGVKKETVQNTGKEKFIMTVRESAERNLANRKVHELLAEWYNVPKGKVRLVTGHRSPRKVFDISLES